MLDPGRKSIAQGESNDATGDVAKPGAEPLVGWAVVELEFPQLARATNRAA
jgi:hypothetical protein